MMADAMVNPLFVFFASPAGIAATVLRWTLAAFLFYAAYWNWLNLVGSDVEPDKNFVLVWLSVKILPGWFSVLIPSACGFFLLMGLFARLVTSALLLLIIYCFFDCVFWSPAIWKEMIFSAALCLASTLAGAGSFSFDRKISHFFMPTI